MEWIEHAFRGLLGVAILIGLAVAISKDRKAINWKLVAGGVALHVLLAALFFTAPVFSHIIEGAARIFIAILGFSVEGAAFVFGDLARNAPNYGAIFAFRVLPSIVFFASLMSLLYYFGILQKVVYGMAWAMSKTMRLSGAESLSAAANVFIGMTEAPLVVRPYIERMTKSELFCLMAVGMSTIAGGVMVAYISILGGDDEASRQLFAIHLVTASFLAAPAGLYCCKIVYPETEEIDTDIAVPPQSVGINAFDAVVHGMTEGLKLAANVGGAVLVFTAFAAMFNTLLSSTLGDWLGINAWIAEWSGGRFEGFTLNFLFGILFAPFAWIIGVDSGSILSVGQLLGEKIVLNEFVAFLSYKEMIDAGFIADPHSQVITTFALTSFASFLAIGVEIGGLSVLAPAQRENFNCLALRAMGSATIATLINASIAGIFAG